MNFDIKLFQSSLGDFFNEKLLNSSPTLFAFWNVLRLNLRPQTGAKKLESLFHIYHKRREQNKQRCIIGLRKGESNEFMASFKHDLMMHWNIVCDLCGEIEIWVMMRLSKMIEVLCVVQWLNALGFTYQFPYQLQLSIDELLFIQIDRTMRQFFNCLLYISNEPLN